MPGTGRSREHFLLAAISVCSLAALAAGLIGALAFDSGAYTLRACQCVPYGIAAAVAASAMLVRTTMAARRIVFVLCAVVLASGCAVSVFHEGVQQGWWINSSLCEAPLSPATGITSLQMTLADRLIRGPCDDTDWNVLGLSVAMLNFVYSAILTLGCIVFAVMADGETKSLFDLDGPSPVSRRWS